MEILVPQAPDIKVESYTTDSEEVVWFEIRVKLLDREWTVSHRFNEFDDLHQKLKKNSNISTKLPPKKFRPNSDFLERRREDLERYLLEIVECCGCRIPIKLSEFLLFYKFQPNALLNQLADFLSKNKFLKLTSLHLNALYEVSKYAETDPNYDRVVSILKTLKSVSIYGTKLSYLEKSNLTREKLVFDLGVFEVCDELVIKHCSSVQILGLNCLKGTLKVLEVNGVVSSLHNLFGPKSINKTIDNDVPWAALTRLNIINAEIKNIDDSINLLPNLENLNLHGNELSDQINLDRLLRLTILDLSNNKIESIDKLYVGNISILNLSNNKIKHLAKLSRLLGLVSLNLNSNLIENIDEVCSLNKLPMLQSVDLTDNPITSEPDYRSQILGRIPNRINDVVLDCVIPDGNEISMGKVIAALRQAKITEKEKTPFAGRNFNLKNGPIL